MLKPWVDAIYDSALGAGAQDYIGAGGSTQDYLDIQHYPFMVFGIDAADDCEFRVEVAYESTLKVWFTGTFTGAGFYTVYDLAAPYNIAPYVFMPWPYCRLRIKNTSGGIAAYLIQVRFFRDL